MSPLLLTALDEVVEDPTIGTEHDNYMLHLYALYLLAQFRERRAFPKIIELISLPPNDVDSLLGDVITESLPDILYSTYNGDLSLLQNVIENPKVYLFVRGSALDVVGKLYSDGKITPEYLVSYLRQIIARRTYDLPTETDFYAFIQNIVAEHRLVDMVGDIKRLYEENLIDVTNFGDYDEFLNWMEECDGGGRVKYIEDVIAEMEWWATFQETEEERLQRMEFLAKLREEISIEPSSPAENASSGELPR